MALTASIIVALFLIPPFAAFLFRKKNIRSVFGHILHSILLLIGIVAIAYGYWLGLILIAFGTTGFLKNLKVAARFSEKLVLREQRINTINIIISAIAIVFLLAEYWRPLGFDRSLIMNLLFVSFICFGLLAVFWIFMRYYTRILNWCLQNKFLFLSIPTVIVILGFLIIR